MTKASSESVIRVMVVDDSRSNREVIVDLLRQAPGVEVVAQAANGEEALREANRYKPDVITLDLQMPRMDGFTFLRILMGHQPTPVIVISSYSDQHSVFKALEFGALDFVAKPIRATKSLESIRQELLAKIMLVRRMTIKALAERRQVVPRAGCGDEPDLPGTQRTVESELVAGVVVIGASTGGPTAIQTLLEKLPVGLPLAFLIAQHMPEQFTATFAERLNGQVAHTVVEAEDGEVLRPGKVIIAKGGHHLTVARDGGRLVARLERAVGNYKNVPSVDVLFRSAAQVMGTATLAVVLTGMGDDGAEGVRAVSKAGGRSLAESEDTAIIFGMPHEALATGVLDKVCRLPDLAQEIAGFGKDLPFDRRR